MKLSIPTAIMAFTSISIRAAPAPGQDRLKVVLSVDEIDHKVMGLNTAKTGLYTPKPSDDDNDDDDDDEPIGIFLFGGDPRYPIIRVARTDGSNVPLYPIGGSGWPVNYISIAGAGTCIFYDEDDVKQAQVTSTESGASKNLCEYTSLSSVSCYSVDTD